MATHGPREQSYDDIPASHAARSLNIVMASLSLFPQSRYNAAHMIATIFKRLPKMCGLMVYNICTAAWFVVVRIPSLSDRPSFLHTNGENEENRADSGAEGTEGQNAPCRPGSNWAAVVLGTMSFCCYMQKTLPPVGEMMQGPSDCR